MSAQGDRVHLQNVVPSLGDRAAALLGRIDPATEPPSAANAETTSVEAHTASACERRDHSATHVRQAAQRHADGEDDDG